MPLGDRDGASVTRNTRRISHLDLGGAGQVYVNGNHAYIGHLPNKGGLGTSIVDIADPLTPREVGYFVPEPVDGHAAPRTNDVDVDGRGLVYLVDRFTGFDIVEFIG